MGQTMTAVTPARYCHDRYGLPLSSYPWWGHHLDGVVLPGQSEKWLEHFQRVAFSSPTVPRPRRPRPVAVALPGR